MNIKHLKPLTHFLDHRPMEEALAVEHDLLATLEAMPVGVWIADEAGRFLLTNGQGHRMWGEPPRPIESIADFNLLHGWWPATGQRLQPEDWAMHRVLTRGETIRGEEINIERFDGSRGTVLANGAPIRDDQDRVVGGVVVQQDITERRRTEEALRQSQAQLAAGVQVARLGTFEHDHVKEVIEISPILRELLGLGPQERLTTATILERTIPEDLGAVAAAIQRALNPRGDGLLESEQRLTVPGRGLRWLSIRSQTFFSGEGSERRPVRTVGAVLDTTERKLLEMELERLVAERTAKLQELVGDLEHFSHTITHDMRAPLRAMHGFAQMAQRLAESDGSPGLRDLLRRIRVSADRMEALIRDALYYSRAMRPDLPLERVDAGALLRGMLDSYPEFQAVRSNIRIDGELLPVLANAAGLTQCFSNLLGNAVKFVKPGEPPQVRVWAEPVQRSTADTPGQRAAGPAPASVPFVRLWVEDQGIGVPSEMLPHVFEMFARGQNTYEGTGIGLALVRKVVERMGGRVGVESEEGKGSRFWLELSAAPAESAGSCGASSEHSLPPLGLGKQ